MEPGLTQEGVPAPAEPAAPPPPANRSLASEAMVAVVGILPTEPITADDRLVAAKIPEKFRKKVHEFFHDEQAKVVRAPEVDMEETLELLTEPVDDLDKTLGEISDEEIGTEILNIISKGRQYVAARWPTVVLQQVTGPELMEVSPKEELAAFSLLRSVDEPMQILDEMCSRTLEPSQSEAFRAVYPLLAAMLDQIVWEEISSLGKKRVSWEREQVLRILWNIPPQQRVTTPRGQSSPPPKSSAGEPTKLETKAQRLTG